MATPSIAVAGGQQATTATPAPALSYVPTVPNSAVKSEPAIAPAAAVAPSGGGQAAASGAVVGEPSSSVAAAASTPAVPHSIAVPSCSAWFSIDSIHDTERRLMPEFFVSPSPSRNPSSYKLLRDSIVRRFRAKPWQALTFTAARRGLTGDVGSVRRVFDFLEEWGLINYFPANVPAKSSASGSTASKFVGMDRREVAAGKICTSCRTTCHFGYFVTEKADVTLCTKCYLGGNYRLGLSPSDFKRIDVAEETKSVWSDQETLHLLEALLHYGDDWKRVAQHVGSRSEKECIFRFVKLPFGEQFMDHKDIDSVPYEDDEQLVSSSESKFSKRRRLTPLADASNPIIAQAAFLCATVGRDVAKAAAQSAVAVLSDVGVDGTELHSPGEEPASRGEHALKEAAMTARLQLEKERNDIKLALSDLVDVQMREIQEKILHFEELELLIEQERQQLRCLKDSLFADQLAIKQHQQGET